MRRPRRRALPRPRLPRAARRAALAAMVLAVLLVPGWLWVRDSPLAAVRHVRIAGVSGPQAAQVRQAIEDAARSQSTLDLDPAKIAAAAQAFPIVQDVSVRAHPPHTLDVTVREHVAVAAAVNGARRVAVAADGTLLEGTLTHGLPEVPLATPPGGRHVSEPRALGMIALLGGAPRALLGRISGVSQDAHGLVAHLSDGPDLYFGAARRLTAKWLAAARVLADFSARGAAYLDVRVPERPAAGGMPTDPAAGTTTPEATTPETTATTPVAPSVPITDPQLQVQSSQ